MSVAQWLVLMPMRVLRARLDGLVVDMLVSMFQFIVHMFMRVCDDDRWQYRNRTGYR